VGKAATLLPHGLFLYELFIVHLGLSTGDSSALPAKEDRDYLAKSITWLL